MHTLNHQKLSPLCSAIVRSVLYFDIFKYPLHRRELVQLINLPDARQQEVDTALQELAGAGFLHIRGDYVQHGPDDELIHKRRDCGRRAEAYLSKARFMSRIIAGFPFVKAVCISGSLSKHHFMADDDIDYFIITTKNRLWACRALLTFFKKVFLLNSRKYFCINYYVAEDELEIPDRNQFVATELAYLIPVYNYPAYLELMEANAWSTDFYPNFPPRSKKWVIHKHLNPFKKIFAFLLQGKAGEKLESFSFRIMTRHWKRKFAHFDEETYNLSMRSKKGVSKHHPNNYQVRIMNKLGRKISIFEQQKGIRLS